MIVLFDLDNTIANMDHRLHLLDRDEIDWDAFEALCVDDTPIDPTIVMMRALAGYGYQVWIWTGRSDGVREETIKWLKQYAVPYTQLLMRPHDEHITNTKTKERWLDDSPVPRKKVLCAYDDDPAVIKMLRKQGVVAYQIIRPTDDQ